MAQWAGVRLPDNPWIVSLLIVAAAAAAAYIVNLIVLYALKRALEKTSVDPRIHRLLEIYLFPLFLVLALLLIADAAPIAPPALSVIHHALAVAGLLLAVVLATKGALLVLRTIEIRYGLYNIKAPLEIVTKIVMIAVGGMLILDNLGISLTPILTTLGIGSLAVAIGLQDTLGNFFAGLYIKVDRPIEIGHYIRIQSGEEGYVERIGWRSTRIRMLPNNMVVVPNNKLVQDNIMNYHLPDRELAVIVPVGVAYGSDLEKVERVTLEVAKEVMQSVSGGVGGAEPLIRYGAFGQSSIDFTAVLRAREFADGILLKHEFIKRLKARYENEGIVIPFPARTIYLKGEEQEKTSKATS